MAAFDNLFGTPDGSPTLTDADWRHIERRAQRLARYGRQPPGAQADIAQIRGRAAGQVELATEINDALRLGNAVLAQALIAEGEQLFGRAALVAAVEAQARQDQVDAMEAVRRREADPGDPWADDHAPHDPDDAWGLEDEQR
jgi:hypothetical protein